LWEFLLAFKKQDNYQMKEGEEFNTKVLWDKMKSGDEKALSVIFTLYYSDLFKYSIKIFDQPDLVKDSIQDVFMRIWEKRTSLGDVQNPKAYLISSVRRKLFANKESRKDEISEDLLNSDGKNLFQFSATDFIESEEISQKVRDSLVNAINSLPERQRELVFLRFYYDLRYLEISRIMEVNEQTVRNMMQRALANLRNKIDRKLWEGIDNLDELFITLFILFQKKSILPGT
jgi:RNA polymerase sigma factor (sigma-70 family)